MRSRSWFAVLVLSGAVCACQSVPHDDAAKLAQAGQQVTAASQASLKSLSDDVGLIAERQLVRQAMARCPVASAPTACSPADITPEAQAAWAQDAKLAKVILLRVQAIGSLNDAYGALAAEAAYNARADLDTAIGKLFGSVNTLTGALSAADPAVAAAVGIAQPLVRTAAGTASDQAQKDRLKAANAEIAEAAAQLAKALDAESRIYASIASGITNSKKNLSRTLMDAGVADGAPLVSDFDKTLGLALPDKPPALQTRAAAETIVAYQAWAAEQTAGDVYAANVKALNGMADKHRAFAAGKPVDLTDLAYTIDQLTAWAAAIRGLAATSSAASTSGPTSTSGAK